MRSNAYWIEVQTTGRLAILPRPRGGEWLEDEVRVWLDAGFDTIVSLLTLEEAEEFDLKKEGELCIALGLGFVSFPIRDMGVPPSVDETIKLANELASSLTIGKSVGVHCRQGIGRSSLIAACVLVALGQKPETAFESIGRTRGCQVPETAEQREWVIAFANQVSNVAIAI
jgi:protein-tyrosine phosphatase